jgi:hypothetical protein
MRQAAIDSFSNLRLSTHTHRVAQEAFPSYPENVRIEMNAVLTDFKASF